ncbi:unnamed protein product [Chrysoparadoxa australica]
MVPVQTLEGEPAHEVDLAEGADHGNAICPSATVTTTRGLDEVIKVVDDAGEPSHVSESGAATGGGAASADPNGDLGSKAVEVRDGEGAACTAVHSNGSASGDRQGGGISLEGIEGGVGGAAEPLEGSNGMTPKAQDCSLSVADEKGHGASTGEGAADAAHATATAAVDATAEGCEGDVGGTQVEDKEEEQEQETVAVGTLDMAVLTQKDGSQLQRTDLTPPVSAPNCSSGGSGSSAASGDNWICQMCTFSNSLSKRKCHLCFARRPRSIKEDNMAPTQGQAANLREKKKKKKAKKRKILDDDFE